MSEQPQKAITPTPPARDLAEVKSAPEKIQRIAIDALVAGESIANAARMAGIRRETLSRWVHRNPVFIAKLNEKKNEARQESITCINSIVAQSAAALKNALGHPDINPTAVVQSIMSMLPKMYSVLLAQGEAETDPIKLALHMEAKQLFTRADYLKYPNEDEDTCHKRAELYEKVMLYDMANDNDAVPIETVKKIREEIEKTNKGLKGIRYSIDRERVGI